MRELAILKDVQSDLKIVENELMMAVTTSNSLLKETSLHLFKAGGKRLRPAFALLAGKFHNYSLEKLMPLAVALEMIHMATLVHDDVIDQSLLRRGRSTVKAVWGNQISLNTGDYLFGRSLVLVSGYQNPAICRILANVSVEMCKGEIEQIVSMYDVNQSLKDYFYRIKRKTALLISASCQLGAIASDAPKNTVIALKKYGYYLGMAFQITDDVLDMVANEEALGKPVGSDIKQGIVTLPMILAMKNNGTAKMLDELFAIEEKNQQQVLEIIELIQKNGGIKESLEIAGRYLEKAKLQLEQLPKVPARNSLKKVAEFVQNRNF